MTLPAITTAIRRWPCTVMMPMANITSIAISVVRPESGSLFLNSLKWPTMTTLTKATKAAAMTQPP